MLKIVGTFTVCICLSTISYSLAQEDSLTGSFLSGKKNFPKRMNLQCYRSDSNIYLIKNLHSMDKMFLLSF